MPAVRYRQLEGPAQFDTRIADNGAAAAASSLAEAFKSFSDVTATVGANLQKKRGQEEGAIAGAMGKPDYQTGFKQFTAYSQAYNNAATRSYAIRAEADAEDTAARLRVEANNDPNVFRQTFGAAMDATLKQAPVQARAALADIYNRHLAEGVAALSAGQATEIQKDARSAVLEGVQRSTDRIARWRASDDPAQHALADEEEVKMQLAVDGAVGDRTLTRIEATALKQKAGHQVIFTTVSDRFQKVLEDPYGDPVRFIQNLQKANQTSEALPPDQEAKLVDDLMSQLRDHHALATMQASAAAAAAKLREEAGNRDASSRFIAGTLTRKYLKQLVDSQGIDPTRATTLANELDTRAREGSMPSDPKTKFLVETNLLGYTEDEITHMSGLSYKDRGDLILKRRDWASGWRSQPEGKEAVERIDRALGIIPGTDTRMLSEEQRTARGRALTELWTRVDGLEPKDRVPQAIGTAEAVIKAVITNNAQIHVQTLRNNLQRLKDQWAADAKAHPPSKSELAEQAKTEAEMTRRIQQAQQKAP